MNNTLSYRNYRASLEFDPEDHILVGRVLDIEDVITFHGDSVREFEAAFHAAIDNYLAACEAMGLTADKPASGRIMLRIAPRVHASALKAAAREGKSLNKWAESVLREATHTPR